MSVWIMPRESEEWVGPIDITVRGAATSDFEVAVKHYRTRPEASDFRAPDLIEGQPGILVNGPALVLEGGTGVYQIWARVPGNPENPWLKVGQVVLT